MVERRVLTAAAAALAAFALYRATLLPGFDFGDTGSFQATVGSSIIEPRKAYPLYFAIGHAIVSATNAEPAYALNLASAIEGAIAAAVIVLVGAELTGSLAAGFGAAVLFATSYTFWSQAIIAEVYALHMVFVALTLLLLLRWQRHPTLTRLGQFFAVYALGFGNHLSMILLAPGSAAFLLLAAPDGWRSMVKRRVVMLAIACAAAGALQYAWTLRALWLLPQPPHGLIDALQTFWFDVTKSDWRDTTVFTVPRSMLADRAAMYWFDLTQQFGVAGPILAAIGTLHLAATDLKRAALVTLLYAANVAFAFSYNVGDAHVFYLPSHAMVALLAACGVTGAAQVIGSYTAHPERCVGADPCVGPGADTLRLARPELVERRARSGRARVRPYPWFAVIPGVLLIAYAGSRAYHDFPALDRSHDTRPLEVMNALTAGIDDRRTILLARLNWQLLNGLAYFGRVTRPEVAYAWMSDVLLYAPALVADNAAIGRQIAMTARARDDLGQAYGPLFTVLPDRRTDSGPFTLHDVVRTLPRGTKYVLCILKPTRDYSIDRHDLMLAVGALVPESTVRIPEAEYSVMAGVTGDPPVLVAGFDRPSSQRVSVGGVHVEIRMDSWLASDTIRRMGFGHVIAARQHTLIIERGISFVAFGDDGRSLHTGYVANMFARQPRYLIDTRAWQP